MNKQKEFYLQSSIFYWHAEKWEMNDTPAFTLIHEVSNRSASLDS